MNIRKVISGTLFVAVLFSTMRTHTNPHLLSSESKRYVALVAAGVGAAAGLVGYWMAPKQSDTCKREQSGIWGTIKGLPWKWMAIPAVVAGAAAGLWAYENVPEKLLEGAIKGLVAVENDSLLNTLTTDTATIESLKANHKSLISASEKIKSLNSKIDSIKESLIKVVQSGMVGLAEAAQTILSRVESYCNAVVKWQVKLNATPAFLQEQLAVAKSEGDAANARFWAMTSYHILYHVGNPGSCDCPKYFHVYI